MNALKRFVNTQDMYEDFQDYLDLRIDSLHKSLETAVETKDLYRIQGQIFALRKLKDLREELRASK